MDRKDIAEVRIEEPFGNHECGPPPELSVIIVSYQTCELTLRAIESALSQHGPSREVIVVDNASTDGTASAITRAFPGVRLLAMAENLGFARANNLAALHARGYFLLLLNPDAQALPGAFAEITAFAHHWPHAMIWGGRVIGGDGLNDRRSCARRPSLWSVTARAIGLSTIWPDVPFFNPEAMPGFKRDVARHVDIVIGCFMLIKRPDWQRLGGFDPVYFMYGEDIDLCLRASRIGACPAVTPRAMIVHEEGASQPRAARQVQILAARICYLRQHLPRHHRTIAIGVARMGMLLRMVSYCINGLHPERRLQIDRVRYIWSMRRLWWNGYSDPLATIEKRSYAD